MKTTLLIATFAVPLFFLQETWAEVPNEEPAIADFGDPPASVLEHYKWCLAKKGIGAQTVLLRAFWNEHCPRDGEYDDSIHGRMVLLSAYKLAENYSRMNRADEAILFLNWIKSEDTRLLEEEREPAEQDPAPKEQP